MRGLKVNAFRLLEGRRQRPNRAKRWACGNKKGGHCCPPQSKWLLPLEAVAEREGHRLAVEVVAPVDICQGARRIFIVNCS